MLEGLLTFGAGVAVSSAIAVLILGLVGLKGGRSRPRGALAFGLFAVLWGVHIICVNIAGLLTDAGAAASLLLLGAGALLPLSYFLIEFSIAHLSRENVRSRWARGARLLTGGVALIGAGVLVLQPELLLRDVTVDAYGALADWAPFYTGVQMLFLATLGFSLWTLSGVMVEAPTPRVRKRIATVVAGLGIYTAFAAGNNLAFYTGFELFFDAPAQAIPFILLFLGLALLVGVLAAGFLTRAHRASTTGQARELRLLSLALAGPLVYGALEGALALSIVPSLNTVGLWRLGGVAVLAYGVARWRLFDLPQRTRKAASTGAGVAGAAASGGLATGAVALLAGGIVAPVATGALAFAVSLVPGLKLARRLFGQEDQRGPSTSLEEERYGQRLEAYRAALEASVARGTLEQDRDFLEALRDRFEISEEAEKVLLHLAKQAIVLPEDDGPGQAYDRLRLLGEGGAGRTFLARDRRRDHLVVLKEPVARWQTDQALIDRVLEEARMAAEVRHPNVVRIHEVVRQDQRPIIVMEYVDGGSLETVLRRRGIMAWQEAVAVTKDVLQGLAAIHAAGIVHRDIKPANVLLTGDGRAKIADFGIAQQGANRDTVVEDGPGATSGTPAYMAPEVKAGSAGNPRSDLWAVGALLHECLYGSPPLEGTVLAENRVPEPLGAVMAKALATDPGRRPQSAQAFLAELDQVAPA